MRIQTIFVINLIIIMIHGQGQLITRQFVPLQGQFGNPNSSIPQNNNIDVSKLPPVQLSEAVPQDQLANSRSDPLKAERLKVLQTGINNPNIIPIFAKPPTQDCQEDCPCKIRYFSIRTAGHVKVPYSGLSYAYLATPSYSTGWFYNSFIYYYLYPYPSFQRGDLFIAKQHCDGTYSLQNYLGLYLSGWNLLSNSDGCGERWKIGRNGNGHFIQNTWTNGYLWFNSGSNTWITHPTLRTRVIVEFWSSFGSI